MSSARRLEHWTKKAQPEPAVLQICVFCQDYSAIKAKFITFLLPLSTNQIHYCGDWGCDELLFAGKVRRVCDEADAGAICRS